MSKWTRVRSTFERAHDDFFSLDGDYIVEFYNYRGGTYVDGDMTGETREVELTENCEIVPPAIDSTVRTGGTSFGWDTSIRLPRKALLGGSWGANWGANWGGLELVPLGVDARRPTEAEITDNVDNDTETYQVHGYKEETGSGMVMIRLEEK